MIYTIRNDGETNEKLVLRYKKLFFGSRIVNKLRNERYNERPTTKRKMRLKAIVRSHYRALNSKIYF
jgi:ribosomal protein S21